MKVFRLITILLVCLIASSARGQKQPDLLSVDFLGETFLAKTDPSFTVRFKGALSALEVNNFIHQLEGASYQSLIRDMMEYKAKKQLDDWLYYQLIRRTAASLAPKSENYYRYTLYKWFLLTRSGYDATIKTGGNKILFYVRSDDNIYNIPYYNRNGKTYVCLNYHDYGNNINFASEQFTEVPLPVPDNSRAFSYTITRLPDISTTTYEERDVQFSYGHDDYHFKIKLNPQVKTIFANYPVLDYASYFNIPLSTETYHSLIPLLKKHTRNMTVKNGVDYLMRFTRYAFMYKPDAEIYGTEKRLTPEQTLLYPESDCEDRAALFFYLVKEIYNLPMIVVAWPEHVSVAVRFDKSVGKPIVYNGEKYSICDPTPQKTDLAIGQQLPGMTKEAFEIVYAYSPGKNK